MGVEERNRKEKEELKERALQKEILSKRVKIMKDLEGLKSLPEYKSLDNLYEDIEYHCLVNLCQTDYKNKQGDTVYISAPEIQLRQRVFNAIKDWRYLPELRIKEGKVAEMELEEIAKKEKEELENKDSEIELNR